MKRIFALLSLLVLAVIASLSCGGTETTPIIKPTATMPGATSIATSTAIPTSDGQGDAERGRELAQAKGCLGCHSTDGTSKIGPTWKGLYQKTTELSNGTTVTADRIYLEESIKKPSAKVVQGFQPIMPTITLTDKELQAIIAYIESLG